MIRRHEAQVLRAAGHTQREAAAQVEISERSVRRIEPSPTSLSGQQRFVVAMLAFLQFTVVLDFVVLAPLSAALMPALRVTPEQFGLVVSVYAFSASASGFLTAGFADHFDRKRLLLIFYLGFLVGTALCGCVHSYALLLVARGATGVFGGVLGSIVGAVAADVFPVGARGRVMGYIQAAFAASRVVGIPLALALSNLWGWQSPFLGIALVGVAVWGLIAIWLRPSRRHEREHQERASPLRHVWTTLRAPRHLEAFLVTAFLTTGGFMLMPFSSAFCVHNLGVPLERLPMLYLVAGSTTMLTGPLVGGLADRVGRFRVYATGTVSSIAIVVVFTRLGVTPFPVVLAFHATLFVALSAMMVPAQAILLQVPSANARGAFMAINSSIQQASGGAAAVVAGLVVTSRSDGGIVHFDRLGLMVAAWSSIALIAMVRVRRSLSQAHR